MICKTCNKKQHASEYAIIEGDVWEYDSVCITCRSCTGVCSKCKREHDALYTVNINDTAEFYCAKCLIQPDTVYDINPAFKKIFKNKIVSTDINAKLVTTASV